MAQFTGIAWAMATWNPWIGCKKISPGCKFCYMFREQIGYGKNPMDIHRASYRKFNEPLAWTEPLRIFTCSWSDFFLPEADAWRPDAWNIIKRTDHTYMILTKRSDRIEQRLPDDWGDGYSNVWLGVSVETPDYLYRIDDLARIPAKLRFVSYEPALAKVDFAPFTPVIDWMIDGGESGYLPDFPPRHAETDWFRFTRDTCRAYNIPYFHKQNGGKYKDNGVWGGDLLDGREHHEIPNATHVPKIRQPQMF